MNAPDSPVAIQASHERPLYYVDDGVPEATTRLLRDACAARNVPFVPVDPRLFDFLPERQLTGGELLYRPAVSVIASRVEQFLHAEGVSTFYRRPEDVFMYCQTPPLRFERAGLPIPRTIYCTSANRELVRSYVGQLGGFPVVVKMPGYSGGIGVMRADSLPVLFSILDFVLSQGRLPYLCSYIPDAVHWRLVVLGHSVVAAYRNVEDEDDFRTYAPNDPSYYSQSVPARMEEIAIRAVHLMGSEFGGVDILQHPSGRLYLLEANFPCYFAQGQEMGGIDIAGQMVDHLLKKAARLEKELDTAK